MIKSVHKFSDFDKYFFPESYSSEKHRFKIDTGDIISEVSTFLKEATKSHSIEKIDFSPRAPCGGPMDSSWPMHGYDVHHTGRSPYSTINTSGVEKWRFNANYNVEGTAVIDHNGTIYFGSNYPNFYAIYANGTQKWCKTFGSFICMFGTSPALDENGTIYVPTGSGLVALYSSNGSTKWSYGGDVESSPVIGEDGTVYFGLTSGSKGYVVALYPNGTERWKYQTGHVVYSSPAIGLDGTVYCGSHDGNLYAFYLDNGTMKWAFGTGGWVHGSPAVAEDGTVYIGSDSKYLFALYPNNGTMKWRTNVGAGTSPTIGQDGTIYAGWNVLHAVNPVNGSIKWIFNPGSSRCIEGGTPAHSADGTIYCGVIYRIAGSSQGGEIIAINPDGTEKWRETIAGYRVQSAPAISEDGTVYIGSSWNPDNGYLHAFGPGEQKTIEITQPKPGGIYLLGLNLGNSPNGKTIILGSVTVEAQPSMENEIESVSFIVDGSVQNTTTKPPFEWNMNKRYWKWPPLMQFTIMVTVNYKGGCTWSDSMAVSYFHLRHNYPK